MFSMELFLVIADSSELDKLKTEVRIIKMGAGLDLFVNFRKQEVKSESPYLFDLLRRSKIILKYYILHSLWTMYTIYGCDFLFVMLK